MPSKYIIKGTVIIRSSKQPVLNVRVEAWDKDFIIDDFVGNSITGDNGQFTIEFDQNFFSEIFFDRKPDLYFKIFRDDKLIKSTEDAVIWNISLHDVNILIELEDEQPVIASTGITISGTVTQVTGNTIPSLLVRVSLQLLRDKKTIGEITTNEKGKYSLPVELRGSNAAIIVEAIDANQKVLVSSNVLFSLKGNQTVDLVITDDRYKGNAVFTNNNNLLRSYWSDLSKTADTQKVTVNDILFIANQCGKDPVDVWHYVHANELEADTNIAAEIFYGLFKSGLPTSINSLVNTNASVFKDALKKAVAGNFISDAVIANTDDLVKKWNNYRGDQILNLKTDDIDSSVGDVLSLAVPDEEKQRQIINAYAGNHGNTPDFWKIVAQVAGNQVAKQMNIATRISALAGFQPEMSKSLLADAANMKSDDPLMELAKMNTDDWTNYIKALSDKHGKSVVPSVINEKKEADRVSTYAGILSSYLEKKYPTQAFIGNISKAVAAKSAFAKSRNDLVSFFNNNPSFDIKATPTISLLDVNSKADFTGIKDKKAIVTELKSIQRLSSYTTSFTSINALKVKGLDSAHAILQVPKEKFVADLSPSFASEKACLDVYDQAAANYMQALALFGDVHPSLHSTGATPDAPDLRELFGSLDSCDCEECNSIFSAAAYYTDCLDLLYQKATPVYNELVRRRPDLIKILLTCRNTNTAMPYIDLSLEILENFILSHRDLAIPVPPKFAGDPFFKDPNYQTTWQATELAANPEHLNYYAYELLKTTVYPESLPFNLPLEEARVYLKHLGAQRNQVMTTFFNGNTIAAFTDFNTCMERLLISPEETAILTGAKTGDGSATNGLWNFYGFDKDTLFKPITDPMDASTPLTAASWLDMLKNRVDIFLQQTGISYKDLITIRLCDFINPITNIPAQKRKISIIANASVPADDQDTCKLNLLILDGLDAVDLQKIYRFIRLWRKLNWTMFQLDLAMNAFTPLPDTVPVWQQTLTRIAQSDAIAKQLNLPVETILAFYTTINTNTAYIDYFTADYPLVNSLYAKLFQNKQVIFPTDPAFADPALLGGNLDDHIPAILAALQINAKDYNDLKTDASVITDNKLTLANLSALYRNATLANRLQLSIKDFLSVKSLTGIDPFTDPVTTFTFLSKVDSLKSSGFSIDLVNYLLRHLFQAETGVAATDDEIGLFLSELRAALRGIQTLSPDLQKNTIAQKFSEKLKISTGSAIKLLHVYLPSGVAPANPLLHIEDDFWAADFSLSPFLKTYDDPVNPSLKIVPSKFVRANAVGTEVQVPVLFDNYMRIAKIATFVNQLKLTDDELENILINATSIGCTKLNSLPVVSAVNGNFDAFEILVNLIRARDLLPLGTPPLFDILNNAITPVANSLNSWLTGITTRTNWNVDIVTRLVIQSDPALLAPDGGILKTVFPKDFCNGDLILRISNCITMLKRLGLAPALVAATIQQVLIPDTSQAIKNAAKSKYDEAQWLKLAKPLRDVLRNRQRESLLAYTIYRPDDTQNERWKNSNGIYNYFLIDMEMQPISITSRIKQAICSVQLFIDRVLMNLEFQNFDATQPHLQVNKEFSDQWNEWRKLYRIWEANRQVFCYPENYILPELRKDKSPIFKDLETDLNQNELNDYNVEAAFGHYLEQLDEVARLEVVGLYHQKENASVTDEAIDIVHVFARTYSHPQKYFHRTLEKGEWTPWQKLTIDVDGDHIIPVVFNGRLCLFWLFFTMQSDVNNSIDPTSSSVNSPAKQWHIQVAWSVYHNGKWKGKRLSKKYIKTEHFFNEESVLKFQKQQIFVKSEITSNNMLRLHVQDVYALTRHPAAVANFVSGSFIFDNLNSEPDLEPAVFNLTNDTDNDAIRFPCIPPSETTLVNMQFESNSINQNFFVDHVYELNNSGYHLYSATPGFGVLHNLSNGLYHLVVPTNFKINPLESEFFFQDSKSTFYVLSGLVPSVTVNTPGIRTFFPGITEILPPYRFRSIIPDPVPMDIINHNDPELFFRRQDVTDFVSKGIAANTFNRINTL